MKKIILFVLAIYSLNVNSQNNYTTYAPTAEDWRVLVTYPGGYIEYPGLCVFDTSKVVVPTDTFKVESTVIQFPGLSSQYMKGNGSFDTFPTNLNQFTNGPGYITSAPNPIIYYDQSGTVSAPTKKMSFEVTPSTANGYSIDISAANFSSLYGYSVIVKENTSSAVGVANVAVKTVNSSSIVVNIVEGGSFASLTGLTLIIIVEGN